MSQLVGADQVARDRRSRRMMQLYVDHPGRGSEELGGSGRQIPFPMHFRLVENHSFESCSQLQWVPPPVRRSRRVCSEMREENSWDLGEELQRWTDS